MPETKILGEAESERLAAEEDNTADVKEPPSKKLRTSDDDTGADEVSVTDTEAVKAEKSPVDKEEIKSNDTSDKPAFQGIIGNSNIYWS